MPRIPITKNKRLKWAGGFAGGWGDKDPLVGCRKTINSQLLALYPAWLNSSNRIWRQGY